MIHLDDEQWGRTTDALDQMASAPNALLWLESATAWTRGEIARVSGVSGSTLAAIARGKRPSKSQMSALHFALLARLMSLKRP